ncbi:hypothetical protein Tco_0621783 [Tanacetum coccineum]
MSLSLGEPQTTDASVVQTSSALVVHSTVEEPPSKKLRVIVEIPTIPSSVPLNSIKPIIVDNIPFEQIFANLFSSGASQYSLAFPPKMADKGKGIAQTSDDDTMKQIMSFIEERGLAPSLPNLQHFKAVGELPMTIEEAKLQM